MKGNIIQFLVISVMFLSLISIPFHVKASSTTILGDINGDGEVNLKDLAIFAHAYGSTPTSLNWNPKADLDGNGIVDQKDLAILKAHYGDGLPLFLIESSLGWTSNEPYTYPPLYGDYVGTNTSITITMTTKHVDECILTYVATFPNDTILPMFNGEWMNITMQKAGNVFTGTFITVGEPSTNGNGFYYYFKIIGYDNAEHYTVSFENMIYDLNGESIPND